MILVGLTGSIATGKSTVLKILKELGAFVIDADDLARRAVAQGSETLKRVVERFGAQVLTPQGALDRPAMRRLIFNDPAAKADLEAIIHPEVLVEEKRLIKEAEAADPKAVVVVDLPLLFEIEEAGRFDKVIVVYVDRPTQLQRLKTRDASNKKAAEKAVANQIDIEVKKRLADYVIDNRGALEETEDQVRMLYEELKALA